MDKNTERTIRRLYLIGTEIQPYTAVFQAYSNPCDVLVFSHTHCEAHRKFIRTLDEVSDLATKVIHHRKRITLAGGGSISFLPINIQEDRLRGLHDIYFVLDF